MVVMPPSPSPSGNSLRIVSRMTLAVGSKLVSWKPPPMSRIVGVNPRCLACVKTRCACLMALAKEAGFVAPVPGNLCMFSPSFLCG